MPAIADQVHALESDHLDALAKIDALSAENAIMTDALNAIRAEKAALEAKVTELGSHTGEMVAMVESVANAALAMLRTAKTPPSVAAEVIPFAPRLASGLAGIVDRIGQALTDDNMLKPEAAKQAAVIDTVTAAPAAAPAAPTADAVAAPVEPPLSAVELLKRHSLPPVSLMRPPVDRTMTVAHDVGGLPIFLQRDTVFQRGDFQPARM